MSDSKNHHFLPQFYLRNFADRKQGFFQAEKTASSKFIPTKVWNAGSKRDFHTLDWKERERDRNSIENALSKIEGQQEGMLRKLGSSDVIPEELRDQVCFFVNLMFHRVPAFKNDIEIFLKETMKTSSDILLRSGKFPEPPDVIKKKMAKGEEIFKMENFSISNWKLIQMMFDLASRSPVPGILKGMHSSIATSADPNTLFVTSDVPVVLYDSSYDSRSPYGTGFGTPSVEISIPISATRILIFRHSEPLIDHSLDPEQVHEMNRRMIVSSNRFLYMSKPCEHLLADIELLWDQKAGPATSALNSEKGTALISKQVPVSPANFAR